MSSKDCRKLDGECQGWHSSYQSAKPANASGICNLLNLNHVLRRTFPDFFGPFGHFSSEGVDRFCMRPLFTLKSHGIACIPTFANVRIKFNASQERDTELIRCAFASAFGENVDLVIAMRTHEVAHILDKSQADRP